jgi:addiction module RelE/StbE family toxin
MQVRFSSFAEADLDDIHAYIARRDATAAARLIDGLLRSAFRLAGFPHLGRKGRIENTREFSVPGTSYFLVYTLSEDSIDIERVLHSRRQYPLID